MARGDPAGGSLDAVDPPAWGPAPHDATDLVARCYELRAKPLARFSIDDLRVMIGQQVGLPHLLPLALRRLQENPLAEGEYYPGDLLTAVLSVDEDFWWDHPDLWLEVNDVLDALEDSIRQLSGAIERFRHIVQTPERH